jgi:hypothetical protein
MQNKDSNLYNCSDNLFQATGDCLQYRAENITYFRRLYEIKDENAWKWDLGNDYTPPKGFKLLCTGSRYGNFCYVLIKIVGEIPTKCSGGQGYGNRARFFYQNQPEQPNIGVIVKNYWKKTPIERC